MAHGTGPGAAYQSLPADLVLLTDAPPRPPRGVHGSAQWRTCLRLACAAALALGGMCWRTLCYTVCAGEPFAAGRPTAVAASLGARAGVS